MRWALDAAERVIEDERISGGREGRRRRERGEKEEEEGEEREAHAHDGTAVAPSCHTPSYPLKGQVHLWGMADLKTIYFFVIYFF